MLNLVSGQLIVIHSCFTGCRSLHKKGVRGNFPPRTLCTSWWQSAAQLQSEILCIMQLADLGCIAGRRFRLRYYAYVHNLYTHALHYTYLINCFVNGHYLYTFPIHTTRWQKESYAAYRCNVCFIPTKVSNMQRLGLFMQGCMILFTTALYIFAYTSCGCSDV